MIWSQDILIWHAHAWQMQKEMWPQLQLVAQGATVDTLQWPLGSRSGNAKRQRCEPVPAVSTTTRGLAVCTTRWASEDTLWWKPKHWSKNYTNNYDMLAEKMSTCQDGLQICPRCFLNGLLQVFGMEPLQELHYQRIWHWPCSLWQCKNCCWLVHLEGHSVASQQATAAVRCVAEDTWGFRFYCIFTRHFISCWKHRCFLLKSNLRRQKQAAWSWLGPGAHGLAQPLPLWRSDPALRDLCSSGQRIVRVGVAQRCIKL